MSAVAKTRRSGIRPAERSIQGTMVSRPGARGRQTVGPAPRAALPAAAPSVTSSSRVSIPTPPPVQDRPELPPQPRGRPSRDTRDVDPPPVVPRPQLSPRIQGRASQRAIEPPPTVRQMPVRARRSEMFPEPVAPAPSKIADLRSTIARLQQRLEEVESRSTRLDDMRERAEVAAELLDEAIELAARPEGVTNRRRLQAKLQEARKVIG